MCRYKTNRNELERILANDEVRKATWSMVAWSTRGQRFFIEGRTVVWPKGLTSHLRRCTRPSNSPARPNYPLAPTSHAERRDSAHNRSARQTTDGGINSSRRSLVARREATRDGTPSEGRAIPQPPSTCLSHEQDGPDLRACGRHTPGRARAIKRQSRQISLCNLPRNRVPPEYAAGWLNARRVSRRSGIYTPARTHLLSGNIDLAVAPEIDPAPGEPSREHHGVFTVAVRNDGLEGDPVPHDLTVENVDRRSAAKANGSGQRGA